ncbi:12014_t:CDS:2, partial [Ambispora leptoticha]
MQNQYQQRYDPRGTYQVPYQQQQQDYQSLQRKNTLQQPAEYGQGPTPPQIDLIRDDFRQGPPPQQYNPHTIHRQGSYSSLATDSSRQGGYNSHQLELDPRELDRKLTISPRPDARSVSAGSQLDARDVQRSNSVSPRPDMTRPQGDFHHQPSISRRQNNSSPYPAVDPREGLAPSRKDSGSNYPDARSSPQPAYRQNNTLPYPPESREGGESLPPSQPQQHNYQQPYYNNEQYDNRNYNSQRNADAYTEDSYDYSSQQQPSNQSYPPPAHPNPNYPPPPRSHQEGQHPSSQQHSPQQHNHPPQDDYSSQNDLYQHQHPQGDYPPSQGEFPPPQGDYPPQEDYPPSQGDYPPPQGDYPPPQGDYPPPQGDYPPPQGDYPPPQGDYPPPQGDYGYNGYQQNYPTDDSSYYGSNADGASMHSNYYPPEQSGQFYDGRSTYSQDYPQQGYPYSHSQEYSQDPYGKPALERQYSMKGPLPNRQYDVDNSSSVRSVDATNNRPSYTPDAIEAYRNKAKSAGDPASLLEFAKFLIDAAAEQGEDVSNQKTKNKAKDSLLQEAVKIIKRLATQGIGFGKPAYPEAQFYLANAYGHGSLGLPFDQDKAFSLYMQASKQNHSSATYRTAVCYELGAGTKRDPHRATQFYRKAAALGDTAAMFKLGKILLSGSLSQTKNPREAVTWLKRAAQKADAENPHALHDLGLLHEKKDIQKEIPSIIHDERFALEQFHKAADLGYAPSCFKLGCVYEYGQLGVAANPQKSIYYYSKAAEKGDPDAELALSGWYLTGSDPVLKQSDAEAYLWARRAADKGLSKAEYAIGYYSEVGIGVNQDVEEAKRWYLRAAAQGNKRAQHRLTELKKLGNMRRVKPE